MGKVSIWRSILAEAWQKTASDLRLSGGVSLMTPALLFSIYALLVWFVVGEQHAFEEVRDRILLLVAPLLVLPLWWAVRVILTVPEREQKLGGRIRLLHTYMQPRLNMEILHDGLPVKFPLGDVTRTAGGGVVTNITGHEQIICAVVKNTSAKDAQMVNARFSELLGDNGSRLSDPIALFWTPTDGPRPENSAVVPAGGERRLQIFRVTPDGVYFANRDVPLEYQQFFSDGSRFNGKLVLEEIYHCSLEIHFTLEINDTAKLQIVHSNGVAYRTGDQWEAELARSEASNG